MNENTNVPIGVVINALRAIHQASEEGPPPDLEMDPSIVKGSQTGVHATCAKILYVISEHTGISKSELFAAAGLPETPFDFLLSANPKKAFDDLMP